MKPVLDHIRQAFIWSREDPAHQADIAAAMLGMGVPVALGYLSGHPSAGFMGALGSFAVGRIPPSATLSARVKGEVDALVPLVCAGLAVIALAWLEEGRAPVIAIAAGLAVLLGSYSRALSVAAARAVLLGMIIGALPLHGTADGFQALAMMIFGGLWTALLAVLFHTAARNKDESLVPATPAAKVPVRERLKHLAARLSTLEGWNYPLRLTIGLLLAIAIGRLWPGHHASWISLTVALLTPRDAEWLPVRATQRVLGTLIGVGIAGIALQSGEPIPVQILTMTVLAGLRAFLRPGNYLAYSAVMTPLVILIIEAGQPMEPGLLSDRLIATILGAALVIACNGLFVLAQNGKKPPKAEPPPGAS